MSFDPDDKHMIDRMFALVNPQTTGTWSFNLIVSTVIVQSSILNVVMLQRT